MDPMDLLKTTLPYAVALGRLDLERLDPDARREKAWQWAGEAVDALQRDGDKLLTRVPDRTAAVFSALARGLAGLAVTGGVEFAGLRFGIDEEDGGG